MAGRSRIGCGYACNAGGSCQGVRHECGDRTPRAAAAAGDVEPEADFQRIVSTLPATILARYRIQCRWRPAARRSAEPSWQSEGRSRPALNLRAGVRVED